MSWGQSQEVGEAKVTGIGRADLQRGGRGRDAGLLGVPWGPGLSASIRVLVQKTPVARKEPPGGS